MPWFALLYLVPPLLTWMAFSAWSGWQRYRATRSWVPTTATVTAPGRTRRAVRSAGSLVEAGPRLQYEPWGEQEREVHVRHQGPLGARAFRRYQQGGAVPVRYNPQHPEEVIVDEPTTNGLAPIMVFACLAVIPVLTLTLYVLA